MSITVSGLSFGYEEQLVLNNVSFTAKYGQLLSILGPNGVGKSTLLRCILGLLKGYRGQIVINGVDIKRLGIKELARLIAYIPQSHYPSFNFSVFDMVLMGTTVQLSSISIPSKKQAALVETTLERLGIAHLKNRDYTRISGGERQLVLMARAMVQEARILILDEPTANLDFGNQIRVLTEVRSLAKDGYTIVQTTHNPDQAFLFSDRVLALKSGRVLANGSPAEIVNGELMQALYGVEIEVQSLYEDKVRICIPRSAIKDRNRSIRS